MVHYQAERQGYSKYALAVLGKPYDDGVRPPVSNLMIESEQKNIILNWEYSYTKPGTSYVIYKQDKNGKMYQYERTVVTSFTDKNTSKSNVYAIRVITDDGGQSKLSNEVSKSLE